MRAANSSGRSLSQHEFAAVSDACGNVRRHLPRDLRAPVHTSRAVPDACSDLRRHVPRDLCRHLSGDLRRDVSRNVRARLHPCRALPNACRDLCAERNLRARVPDASAPCDLRADLHARHALRHEGRTGLPVPNRNLHPRCGPVHERDQLRAPTGGRGGDGRRRRSAAERGVLGRLRHS